MTRTTRPPLRLLPLAAALAAAACGPGEAEPAENVRRPSMTADTTAPPDPGVSARLDSVYATFARAYAEADVGLLMDEVYARDAFYLPPGEPILDGQDQFRRQFQSFLEPIAARGGPGPRISFDIVDRDIAGGLAYDIGYYTIRPPNAPEAVVGSRGKFIVIWKRTADGRWRIHADGFSAVDQ